MCAQRRVRSPHQRDESENKLPFGGRLGLTAAGLRVRAEDEQADLLLSENKMWPCWPANTQPTCSEDTSEDSDGCYSGEVEALVEMDASRSFLVLSLIAERVFTTAELSPCMRFKASSGEDVTMRDAVDFITFVV
ncbi:hypothetical protein EPH_0017340 [Eimeria praecox]|uniref:Uncharacterized protein n=1 Tax=Eimeria praecox TaxID=51316 RepID=U6H0A3_9EIME|nr:hypothetical protein EPH_0017340 [Eimeria praecox]